MKEEDDVGRRNWRKKMEKKKIKEKVDGRSWRKKIMEKDKGKR